MSSKSDWAFRPTFIFARKNTYLTSKIAACRELFFEASPDGGVGSELRKTHVYQRLTVLHNTVPVGHVTVVLVIGPIVSTVNERRRVGIFGGTFDPPHVAHVVLAAAAMHQLALSVLVVTVAGVPWQKIGSREISSGETRLKMAQAAFSEVEGVEVSDMELRRTGNSYTVDTLHELSAPDTDLVLLLGSDAAAGLDTWSRHEEIASLASIAVFPRRGHETSTPPNAFAWELLELPGLEVSSTDIRERVRSASPIEGLVPPAVRRIVEDEALYRLPADSA